MQDTLLRLRGVELVRAETVYLLWFVQEKGRNDENELLIGVYPSEATAKAAIDRLKAKPGFVDFPDGFQIHTREIGRDSWTEGFIRAE